MKIVPARQTRVELGEDGEDLTIIITQDPQTGEARDVRIDHVTNEPYDLEGGFAKCVTAVLDSELVERAAVAIRRVRQSLGDTREVCADHGRYDASNETCCPGCLRIERARQSAVMLGAREDEKT